MTGIGVVSPVGSSLAEFWTNLVEGRSGIGPLTLTPTDRLSCKFAAEVRDFDPAAHFDRKRLSTLDRFSQLTVVAARAALLDSGLDLDREARDRIPVLIGTAAGGSHTLDENFLSLYGRNAARLPPLAIPRGMFNAAVSQVSMDLGLQGEAYAIASACASGTHAIGQALRAVRSGDADIAITGGGEACLTVGIIKAWEGLRVMGDEPCRPFSAGRTGMTLGEGAAILVIEEEGRARRRGARIYGRLSGFGASADAGDLVAPSVEGPARAIRLALAKARLGSDEIDYVNAHGTGTAVNDVVEARAIHEALGSRAKDVPVSSSKAVLGHGLGVAGALEAAATLLAIHHGVVPPTANWIGADPEIQLDVVPNEARMQKIRAALSNSFAFGGLNAVIAFTAV